MALREHHIIYRDVKPENFVIDAEGYIKLTDFGFSLTLPEDGKVQGLCGSFEYMAPEMIQRKPYTYSYDVYSLGILLYEILVGKTPFSGIPKNKVMIIPSTPITYPEYLSKEVVSLISEMTFAEPSKRRGSADLSQVLTHPWLKEHPKVVNQVYNRNVSTSPFLQIEVAKPIIQPIVSEGNQKLLEISYNHLDPPFEV